MSKKKHKPILDPSNADDNCNVFNLITYIEMLAAYRTYKFDYGALTWLLDLIIPAYNEFFKVDYHKTCKALKGIINPLDDCITKLLQVRKYFHGEVQLTFYDQYKTMDIKDFMPTKYPRRLRKELKSNRKKMRELNQLSDNELDETYHLICQRLNRGCK